MQNRLKDKTAHSAASAKETFNLARQLRELSEEEERKSNKKDEIEKKRKEEKQKIKNAKKMAEQKEKERKAVDEEAKKWPNAIPPPVVAAPKLKKKKPSIQNDSKVKIYSSKQKFPDSTQKKSCACWATLWNCFKRQEVGTKAEKESLLPEKRQKPHT